METDASGLAMTVPADMDVLVRVDGTADISLTAVYRQGQTNKAALDSLLQTTANLNVDKADKAAVDATIEALSKELMRNISECCGHSDTGASLPLFRDAMAGGYTEAGGLLLSAPRHPSSFPPYTTTHCHPPPPPPPSPPPSLIPNVSWDSRCITSNCAAGKRCERQQCRDQEKVG